MGGLLHDADAALGGPRSRNLATNLCVARRNAVLCSERTYLGRCRRKESKGQDGDDVAADTGAVEWQPVAAKGEQGAPCLSGVCACCPLGTVRPARVVSDTMPKAHFKFRA